MRIFVSVLFFALPAALACASSDSLTEPDLAELTQPVAVSAASPFQRFNELNSLIRDGRITRALAQAELQVRLSAVRDEYYRRGGRDHAAAEWVFPLEGYDVRAVAKGRRHGFVAGGYDFYSGNRHGGHPALDIFIHDRRQTGRDDRSGRPVRVLSMTGGVVVAVEQEWDSASRLRGGRYIWVYDPGNRLLVYYAHNDELLVGLGELVRPGDAIATVGRSGYNAAKRRSLTHLHLSVLAVNGTVLTPVNYYAHLRRARVMQADRNRPVKS